MQYTYNVRLHNAETITITRACRLADMIQEHIDKEGAHVQHVGLDKQTDVLITIQTTFKVGDLFSIIYDNRVALGYKDFSVYYSQNPPSTY
jgi:hypothetical protein